MESNDLRIGNCVYWNSRVYQIQDIDHLHFHIFFDPIPITPEILEKCEFEKHGNSNEYWTFYKLKNGWHISWSHHNEPSAGVRRGFVYYSDEYLEVKYLHKLQNLYYSLTNTELIFNP